jgi:hypothetical protein
MQAQVFLCLRESPCGMTTPQETEIFISQLLRQELVSLGNTFLSQIQKFLFPMGVFINK